MLQLLRENLGFIAIGMAGGASWAIITFMHRNRRNP